MHIGINATVVGRVVTGVTRYITELTNHLAAGEALTAYTRNSPEVFDWFDRGARVRAQVWAGSRVGRALGRAIMFPYLARRDHLDVFHEPGYFVTFAMPCPTVGAGPVLAPRPSRAARRGAWAPRGGSRAPGPRGGGPPLFFRLGRLKEG